MGASWLPKVHFRMVVNWVHHQLLKMDLIMVANGCITAAEDWSAYGTCWALVTRRMCSCNSGPGHKSLHMFLCSLGTIIRKISLSFRCRIDFLVLQMQDLNQQEEQFFSLLVWFNTANFNHYVVSVCAHLLGSLCSCCYSYLKWCRRSPWYKPDRFSLIMKWRIPSDTITSSSSRCKLGQTKILCVLILSILWFWVSNFFGWQEPWSNCQFYFSCCEFQLFVGKQSDLPIQANFRIRKRAETRCSDTFLLCMGKNLRMQIRV